MWNIERHSEIEREREGEKLRYVKGQQKKCVCACVRTKRGRKAVKQWNQIVVEATHLSNKSMLLMLEFIEFKVAPMLVSIR